MSEETNNRTIAKNATVLYIRMFITIIISLFTSRIVLQALGVSDYGIYTLVGGVTSLVHVFIGALGSSTSRFLTFALGKNNMDNLKMTFSTAVLVHIGLSLIFIVVAETVGLWFVNTQLVIPEGRMVAANWVYQSFVVSVAMGITQTPYSASITSHEKMSAFAYITIINSLVKLGIAAVVLIYAGDHLILYSILLLVSSICFRLYYRYYCIKHFEECHITRNFDKPLFLKMLTFSGWTMLSSVSLTIKNQGINVLINRFFGTLLNAAVGVASQIQGILYVFTGNVTTAFAPQITKSYAAENYSRTNELIEMGTKFTTLITTLTTIPFIFNMDYIMSLWLVEVPAGAVVICQICLFANFFNSFNPFICRAIYASGKIKEMNIFLSIYYITFLAGMYLVLKLTHSYVWGYIYSLLSSPPTTFLYMIMLKRAMPSFSMKQFFSKIYIPMFLIAGSSLLLAAAIYRAINRPLFSFASITIICSSYVVFVTYRYVMNEYMRTQMKKYVMSFIKKFV